MAVKELLDKLEKSKEFKAFKKKHPKAYFCAGFFVLDFDTNELKQQLDYFISEKDGIETFAFDNDQITQQKAETIKKEKLDHIKGEEVSLEFEKAVEIAKAEVEKSKLVPSKVIAVLQIVKITEKDAKDPEKIIKEEKKLIWNLTCLSGFKILRLNLAMDGKVLLEKNSSMLDMMRIEKKEDQSKPDYTG